MPAARVRGTADRGAQRELRGRRGDASPRGPRFRDGRPEGAQSRTSGARLAPVVPRQVPTGGKRSPFRFISFCFRVASRHSSMPLSGASSHGARGRAGGCSAVRESGRPSGRHVQQDPRLCTAALPGHAPEVPRDADAALCGLAPRRPRCGDGGPRSTDACPSRDVRGPGGSGYRDWPRPPSSSADGVRSVCPRLVGGTRGLPGADPAPEGSTLTTPWIPKDSPPVAITSGGGI